MRLYPYYSDLVTVTSPNSRRLDSRGLRHRPLPGGGASSRHFGTAEPPSGCPVQRLAAKPSVEDGLGRVLCSPTLHAVQRFHEVFQRSR